MIVINLSFGANFFLSASLNQLFSLVETMQILTVPTLFNVLIPAFPCAIITMVLSIAHFDLIEVGEYFEQWFETPPTQPLTQSLERIGFETSYFIYNLGTLSIIMACFFINMLLLICLSRKSYCGKQAEDVFCFRRVNAFTHRMLPRFFWNGPVQLAIESHLLVFLSAFI